MFLGHFGVALAAKRAAPRASLGTLVLAAQFLDLLWPTLLALGVERVRIDPQGPRPPGLDFVSYPYSHSLLMALLWSLVLGGIWLSRGGGRVALVVALCVASHWFLDLLVHAKDLPLLPSGDTKVGLGLWAHPWATWILEIALLALGAIAYGHFTRPVNSFGRSGFWVLLFLLVAIYVASIVGPPPSSTREIVWAGEAQWLIVLFAYAIDRHRVPRSSVAPLARRAAGAESAAA